MHCPRPLFENYATMQCQLCTEFGILYIKADMCVTECPEDSVYYEESNQKFCVECSEFCNGCTGPKSTQCIGCIDGNFYLKIYLIKYFILFMLFLLYL